MADKEIDIVSKKFGTHKLIVSESDYESVMKYRWHINKFPHTMYASAKINNKQVRLHRFILGGEGMVVDHKDGNGLNCSRDNMRLCTTAENARNRSKNEVRNKSGYKGVWFCNLRNKFKSQIRVGEKRITVGTFTDSLSAAIAYNEAAIKYHGEFAKLNII